MSRCVRSASLGGIALVCLVLSQAPGEGQDVAKAKAKAVHKKESHKPGAIKDVAKTAGKGPRRTASLKKAAKEALPKKVAPKAGLAEATKAVHPRVARGKAKKAK